LQNKIEAKEIWQVILEVLDLIPDCQNQTLFPSPESPTYPSLKMK
jgi:hypothetical protein